MDIPQFTDLELFLLTGWISYILIRRFRQTQILLRLQGLESQSGQADSAVTGRRLSQPGHRSAEGRAEYSHSPFRFWDASDAVYVLCLVLAPLVRPDIGRRRNVAGILGN